MFQKQIQKSTLIIFFAYLVYIPLLLFAETNYKVKSTDNLSRIIQKFYKNSKLTRQQIFIGILAENPRHLV